MVDCGREGVRSRSSAVVGMGEVGVAGLEGAGLLVMVGHHQEHCRYRSGMHGDLAGAVVEERYNFLLLVEGHWRRGRGVERRRRRYQRLLVGVVRGEAFGLDWWADCLIPACSRSFARPVCISVSGCGCEGTRWTRWSRRVKVVPALARRACAIPACQRSKGVPRALRWVWQLTLAARQGCSSCCRPWSRALTQSGLNEIDPFREAGETWQALESREKDLSP